MRSLTSTRRKTNNLLMHSFFFFFIYNTHTTHQPTGERVPFFACGLSSVMHPRVRTFAFEGRREGGREGG